MAGAWGSGQSTWQNQWATDLGWDRNFKKEKVVKSSRKTPSVDLWGFTYVHRSKHTCTHARMHAHTHTPMHTHTSKCKTNLAISFFRTQTQDYAAILVPKWNPVGSAILPFWHHGGPLVLLGHKRRLGFGHWNTDMARGNMAQFSIWGTQPQTWPLVAPCPLPL